VNLGSSRSQLQPFGVAVPGVMLHHAHHETEQEEEAR